jgi:hypothetical protein
MNRIKEILEQKGINKSVIGKELQYGHLPKLQKDN